MSTTFKDVGKPANARNQLSINQNNPAPQAQGFQAAGNNINGYVELKVLAGNETLHQSSFVPLKAEQKRKASDSIYLNNSTHILGVFLDNTTSVRERPIY